MGTGSGDGGGGGGGGWKSMGLLIIRAAQFRLLKAPEWIYQQRRLPAAFSRTQLRPQTDSSELPLPPDIPHAENANWIVGFTLAAAGKQEEPNPARASTWQVKSGWSPASGVIPRLPLKTSR